MTTQPEHVVRIGTRASPLALAQAEDIADRLKRQSNGLIVGELIAFTTSGDRLTTQRLINAGGKGLFTRELDRALDAGEIDIGVHSLKDVPSQLPEGHAFLAFPERADPREGFLSPVANSLADLPTGAVLGTASLRREAQTRRARPDLEIVTFRGNVQTRMAKLEAGEASATYLAMAGLQRLGLTHVARPIRLQDMLPAPCQGIVAVTAIPQRLPGPISDLLRAMTDESARRASIAERAFLRQLDGSCRTPIAAHLFEESESLVLRGEILSPDGRKSWQAEGHVPVRAEDGTLSALGLDLGRRIRDAAGDDFPVFNDG